MRLWFVTVIATVQGCAGGPCTIGDEIRVDAVVTDPAGIMGTTAMLCINSACARGTFGTPSPTPSMDYYPGVLTGDLDANVIADPTDKADVIDLQIFVPFTDPVNASLDYADGDVYTLTVVDSAGTQLLDATRSAMYATYGTSACGYYKSLHLEL
jgi:hypothetical protein